MDIDAIDRKVHEHHGFIEKYRDVIAALHGGELLDDLRQELADMRAAIDKHAAVLEEHGRMLSRLQPPSSPEDEKPEDEKPEDDPETSDAQPNDQTVGEHLDEIENHAEAVRDKTEPEQDHA